MSDSPNILLTGWSGNIGQEIAGRLPDHRIHALVRRPARAAGSITPVLGDLHSIPGELARDTELIIHCAADTRFRAEPETLRRTNVSGTQALLRFASHCPRLRKILHISTTCVSGSTTGIISETRLPRPAHFVNAYEESKWEAEEAVFESRLPYDIVRLSTVAGSAADGSVIRPGALHRALWWLWRGLIPMMPGDPATRVDLISTEYAGEVIARAAGEPAGCRVIHACAGTEAPTLDELLGRMVAEFSRMSHSWRRSAVLPPQIVSADTFALFEKSVHDSGDALFARVCADAQSFLPGLLHPRVYANQNASSLSEPFRDWPSLVALVLRHVIEHSISPRTPAVAPPASHQ
jgi:nucleoside-diphosphate-sugar epimerase